MPVIRCPKCFKIATRRETQYGSRFSCCDLWSWGGRLVDAETHALRQKAHAIFDPLWKDGTMSRKEAYKRLAGETHIPRKECHFELMDKKRLTKVIAYLEGEREPV